jgi:nitroreductase
MTPLLSALSQRYSARSYDGSLVSSADLHSLLEAARWAPSSRNEQPWTLVVATRQDQDAFPRLLACLTESNQGWAKDASALILCCPARNFAHKDLPNPHAWHDMGLALMAMAVQASSLGLQMRLMGGIDADKARLEFKVPATHDISSALALGVPGDNTDYLAKRERKALESFVFKGVWGQAYGL